MGDAPHAVFIGYRRADTADVAGRLYDRLEDRFGENSVFKDVDSIPIGVAFRDYVPEVIAKCRVFLALIGPDWLGAGGETRRLDDPDDLVRIEVETALAAAPRLAVVPVLVNGARAPDRSDLPASMSGLADYNAAILRRDPDFRADVGKLLNALEPLLLTHDTDPVEEMVAELATNHPELAWWFRAVNDWVAVEVDLFDGNLTAATETVAEQTNASLDVARQVVLTYYQDRGFTELRPIEDLR